MSDYFDFILIRRVFNLLVQYTVKFGVGNPISEFHVYEWKERTVQ